MQLNWSPGATRNRAGPGFDRLLVYGRWLVLLAIIITLVLDPTVRQEQPWVMMVVALMVVYNGILHLSLIRNPETYTTKQFTVVVDLILVGALVGLSGNIRSHFFDIFYLVLIAAGMQRRIQGGVIAAVFSITIVLFFELFTEQGGPRLSDIDHLLSTIPYLILVGLASGFLSDQLAKEADRRRQVELHSQELTLEAQRVRSEMLVARQVQAALLPAKLPQVSYVDIAVKTIAARDIGGDLYDLDYAVDGSFMASIIDVSGKGVPAALALSGIKSSLDSSNTLGLSALLKSLNSYMLDNTPEDMFATMAICRLSADSNVMQVVSAGHEHVLVVRKLTATVDIVVATGLPLGVCDTAEFSIEEVMLRPGDVIVMYTDGVTDARCLGTPIEAETIKRISAANVSGGSHGILEAIFSKLENECAMIDDATVVAFMWKGQ